MSFPDWGCYYQNEKKLEYKTTSGFMFNSEAMKIARIIVNAAANFDTDPIGWAAVDGIRKLWCFRGSAYFKR